MQINIFEGRAGYLVNGLRFNRFFIFIPSSDNRNSKINKWKQSYWEFNCIKIHYVGTERQTNAIINNIGYVHFACSEGSKVRRLFQKWRMAKVLWPTETAPNEASTYDCFYTYVCIYLIYIFVSVSLLEWWIFTIDRCWYRQLTPFMQAQNASV